MIWLGQNFQRNKHTMHINTNQIHFSPSDLTQFLESPFASWMEHLALTNPDCINQSDDPDAMLSILQDKGEAHELEALASFKSKGMTIIQCQHAEDPEQETISAMEAGADVIYQASLSKDPSVPATMRQN
jgi:hypothetical protein